MATTYDIAKIVGVNQSTVSRVLSNRSQKIRVSKETRKKILEVASQMNFYPDYAAKSLAMSATQTIGVCVYPGEGMEDNFLGSYHLPRIINGIKSYLYNLEYDILLVAMDKPNIDLNHSKRLVYEGRVDGLILLSMQDNAEGIESLVEAGKPVVMVDTYNEAAESLCVNIDNRQAAAVATRYLLSLGHCRIGFLGYLCGPENKYEMLRRQGYEIALKEAGIGLSGKWTISGSLTQQRIEKKGRWCFECGYYGVKELLQRDSTVSAAFCINDLVAAGAMAALSEMKISVPNDFSLIGFDNSVVADHVNPSLTTINHDFDKMGSIAAEKLVNAIESRCQRLSKDVYYLNTTLSIKESTAPFRG